MKFIKSNLKIILFLLVIIIVITLFNMFINREVNYSTEYDYEEYHVIESYDKDRDMYLFNISKDSFKYDFDITHKYTKKRKIINSINSFDRDDYKCISINVFNEDSPTICNKDNDYYDNDITLNKEDNLIKEERNVSIYNDSFDYLIWNGYGYTSLIDNKDYNVLSNESYTNELVYQFKNYIIFADYDQKREFNKFYIYDNNKKTISSWDLKFDISFDSYFLGYIDDDIYLFDVSNQREFRINIEKKRIKKINKGDMVLFYENGRTNININNLIYNQAEFIYDSIYSYYKLNDTLYYKFYKSDKGIRVSDLKIDNILYSNNDIVYYMSGNTLYSYKIHEGEKKLAQSFEWNFDYINKIFVFRR